MPSAANVKIDKQISPETSGLAESSGSSSPLRQAITIIEHKIRNLEKRKSKLESYRDLQNAGKELNGDQKTAVAKYDEVIQTLDFARDLCKQFISIAACSEKDSKKQAKKDAAAKSQAELARLREILLVQDALNQMGNEAVREDFLHGKNGAAQLSENDLKLLDDLYPAVTPKHESGNPTAFTNEVQAAAEHLLAVVDGKPKEIFGGSYSQVKEILGKIHESGYFDQAQEYAEVIEGEEMVYVSEEQQLESAPLLDADPTTTTTTTTVHNNQQESIPEGVVESPFQSQQQQQQQLAPNHDPAPELAVAQQQPPEQMFYQQQQQQPPQAQMAMQPPPQQPARPIAEMLGTGNFFFLQDSEIDNTPIDQIPSQTFTNQSFSGGPPPPLPMPPHFQTMGGNNGLPPQMQQQSPPSAGAPIIPVAHNKNGHNNHHHHHNHNQQQQQQHDDPSLNNVVSAQAPNDHHHHPSSIVVNKGGNNNNGRPRNNNNYYQQHNNYSNNSSSNSNRPRQNRNGNNMTRQQGGGNTRNNNN